MFYAEGVPRIFTHYASEGNDGSGKALLRADRHADLLFEIVSRRYEHKSTVVTTNRPFAEWGEVFPNAACVVSLIDRLVHHAEILLIEGESYRMKEAQERSAKRKPSTRVKKTNGAKR